VHPGDDPEDCKQHHQAAETHAEEEHESFLHGPSLPGKGKLLAGRSGQCGNGVCPGLDGRKDCVRFVGGDTDLFAGKRHVVDLPGRVVALDGGRIPLGIRVVHRVPAHGGGKVGVRKDCGLRAVEPGHGSGPGGHVPDSVRFKILEIDPGGIAFPGLVHGRHGAAGRFVCSAPEGIGIQDTLDDPCKGGDIRYRSCKLTGCRLDIALLDKICHC